MSDVSRREFLRAAALSVGVLSIGDVASACTLGGTSPGGTSPRGTSPRAFASSAADPWAQLPAILARIKAPSFPARDFDITRYGAKGDGTTDCTRAIRDAIVACAAAGGGRVIVPSGRFLTGAVHLASRVNLHLADGATFAFSTDPSQYLPAVQTRFEGMEYMGYSPLVYANGLTDVAITGTGTLDGQASDDSWWKWKGGKDRAMPNQVPARDRLIAMVEQGVPVSQRVFTDGAYLRPQFLQFYRCRNVLVEGITIRNSPMWEVHPVESTNVIVRKVHIDTHGPNNDGCDPESCTDVLIDECVFDTGDDCIAIKSGRNADGRRINRPSENIIVRNCTMKDGHGGVTLGSEISGGVRNVFIEGCTMDSPELERALRFKNNAMRGGVLEHVYMRNCVVGEVKEGVLSIDLYYEEGPKGPYTPIVRDVELRHVTSRKSMYGLYMRAYPTSEISDIRIIDCQFDGVEKGNVVDGVKRLQSEHSTMNGRPFAGASPT